MSDPVGRAASSLDDAPRFPSPWAAPGSGHPAGTILRSIRIGQAAFDVAAVLVGLGIADVHPGTLGAGGAATVPLVAVLWLAVFAAFGLYRSATLPPWEELRRTIAATIVGIVLIVTVTLWRHPTVHRSALVASLLVVLVLELAARRLWRWIAWQLKKRGVLVLPTLIVGTDDDAAALGDSLARVPTGYAPIGHVSASGDLARTGRGTLGDVGDLDELIRDRGVQCVFVGSTSVDRDALGNVWHACRRAGIEMRISANVPQILPSRMCMHGVGDVVAISIQPASLTPFQVALKRLFDLVLASVGFVILSPLLCLIWGAIRVTSGSPALFHQERVTKDGMTFRLHKFRTMVTNADSAENIRRLQLASAFYKREDDPRITRVGRFLRRYSLDELPQLWNVICGEMSLVGPRPLRIEQVTENEQLLGIRHEVKAGLTGWWQIHGRNDVSPAEAVRMDAFYIENWSLGLDLYIVLKTIPALVKATGAY